MPVENHQRLVDSPTYGFRSQRILCDCSPEVLHDFQSIGMQLRLPKGAVLFQRGDPASSIAVVCEGQVKLQNTSGGKKSILKIAMPGDVLGLGAVASGGYHELTAVALEAVTVKSIRKDELLSFLDRHNQLSILAARILSEEYKSSFFDVCGVPLVASAAGRLASVLLDLGRNAWEEGEQRFTLTPTHEELANLAGISRETVTRMLGRFRREHWIHMRGSSVTILAPEYLMQLAS